MDWITVRNVGALGVDTAPSQKTLQPATEFLQAVTEAFARASANFFNEIQELPFIYRERQVQAQLLPAIHQVADVVFVEFAIDRAGPETTSSGRLDYVVRYKKKYVFFIELKFGWVAATSTGLRQDVREAWKEAHNQLTAIPPRDLEDLGNNLGAKKRTSIKMALLLAPCYQASVDAKKLHPYDQTIAPKISQRMVSQLEPSPPNLGIVWALHERLQEPHQYEKDRKEIYPCVAFVAGVETL